MSYTIPFLNSKFFFNFKDATAATSCLNDYTQGYDQAHIVLPSII